MKKSIFLVFCFFAVTSLGFSQGEDTLDSGKAWLGGGFFYNNHSTATFDGTSYYSSDNASFYGPLWQDAPGFFVNAGFGFGSSTTDFMLANSISYYRAVHSGAHLAGSFEGQFNDIMLSEAVSFFKIGDFIQPYLLGAMSWSWLTVENGVILADSTKLAASYPGLGFHLGAGVYAEMFDLLLLDIGGGYRILDYLSGAYEGFSAHFEGDGSGWYFKIGLNIILYNE